MGVLITIDSQRYLRVVEYRARKLLLELIAVLCQAIVRATLMPEWRGDDVVVPAQEEQQEKYDTQVRHLCTQRVVSLAEYREISWKRAGKKTYRTHEA